MVHDQAHEKMGWGGSLMSLLLLFYEYIDFVSVEEYGRNLFVPF